MNPQDHAIPSFLHYRATLCDGCEWSAELPVDLLPGEEEVPGSCHSQDKISGECCFAAETGTGRIDVKLYWVNTGSKVSTSVQEIWPLCQLCTSVVARLRAISSLWSHG